MIVRNFTRTALLWGATLTLALASLRGEAAAPRILTAGFGHTLLVDSWGGTFEMNAWVGSRGTFDVERVEIYAMGQPTGAILYDDGTHGDPVAGDEHYTIQMNVGGGVRAGKYLLELAAFDHSGNRSTLWPYFQIYPGYVEAPEPFWVLEDRLINGKSRSPFQLMQASIEERAGGKPVILDGGYLGSILSEEGGGYVTLVGNVETGASPVSSVRVLASGSPTGLILNDDGSSGDFDPHDGYYGFAQFFLPPLPPTGSFLLEIEAEDSTGIKSDIWPYLYVYTPTPGPSPTPTRTPTPSPTPPPTATPHQVPRPCFTILPQPPVQTVGETFSFDATCTVNYGGGARLYTWNFGDGSAEESSNSPYSSHIYMGFHNPTTDPFVVTLTVQYANGDAASTTGNVYVLP